MAEHKPLVHIAGRVQQLPSGDTISGATAALPLFDDHMASLAHWSTDGAEVVASEAGRFGIARLTTGASVDAAAYFNFGSPNYGAPVVLLSSLFDVEMTVRVPTTANTVLFLGVGGNMFDSLPFGNHGAMFERQATDATWQASVRLWIEPRNANNTANTGVAISTGWTVLRIRRTSATLLQFLINGVVVATADSAAADGTFGSARAPGNARQFGGRIATNTAAARSLDIDRMTIYAAA